MELQQAKEERIKKRKVYSEENIKIAIKEYADRMSGRLWGYKLISVSDIKKINDTTCNAYGIMEKISFDFSKRDSMGLPRSEEHTSELQSHSFISYAVFCLKKKKSHTHSLTFTISSRHLHQS